MHRSVFRHDAEDEDDDNQSQHSSWGSDDDEHWPKTSALHLPTSGEGLGNPGANPLETGIPSHTGLPPWKERHTESPSKTWTTETWTTSVSSYQQTTAYPENAQPTVFPSPIFSSAGEAPWSTQTAVIGSPNNGPPLDWQEKSPAKHGALFAAGIAVPMVMVAIIGLMVFFYLRKRKNDKRKAAETAALQEMKSRNQPFVAAHYNDPQRPSPPMQAHSQAHHSSLPPQYTSSPLHPSPASPPPVILGPIVPDSSGSYLTGIDTSDGISMNDRPGVVGGSSDRTGLGNPFADNSSLNEEPPPPYRPRSLLAPISRDSSLRIPPTAAHSRTNLLLPSAQDTRSPFSDPHDDDYDRISDLSGPTLRRHGNGSGNSDADAMSAVSDMSYQNDPVVVRPTV